ncbi:unnamed protein product, partial [Sphacelaria rigidula]
LRFPVSKNGADAIWSISRLPETPTFIYTPSTTANINNDDGSSRKSTAAMCTTIAHHDNTMVSSTKPEEQQYQQQHRLVKVKAEGREQLIELSADRTFNRPNLHDLLESVVSVFGLQQEQQPQQQQQQQQQRRYQVSLSYLHP